MTTLTFKNFISESINDKGILKAVFIIGLPGAGKSYTVTQIRGSISPKVVNTDKAAEFLSTKWNKSINAETWHAFKDTSHKITELMLTNYIDSMLPLFVDGTSNDVSNILHRMGILESMGYDIGMVFVDTPLEVAIKRAEARALKIGRHVDADFIKHVHEQNAENAAFLKAKVKFFRKVDNNSDSGLDNSEMDNAFKAVQSFFTEPLENPVGTRLIEEMKEKKLKYMCPEIIPKEMLAKKVQGWYKS
jgi:predicted ABC-type ATPase